MADMNNSFRNAWKAVVETVGNAAGNLAQNAKAAVNEMNLENRRSEIFNTLGAKAYELWKNGEQSFPEDFVALLKELTDVDSQLDAIKAEKEAAAEARRAESEARKAAATAEKEPAEAEAPAEENFDVTEVEKEEEAPEETSEEVCAEECGKEADALVETAEIIAEELVPPVEEEPVAETVAETPAEPEMPAEPAE